MSSHNKQFFIVGAALIKVDLNQILEYNIYISLLNLRNQGLENQNSAVHINTIFDSDDFIVCFKSIFSATSHVTYLL